jgi:cytochrome c553
MNFRAINTWLVTVLITSASMQLVAQSSAFRELAEADNFLALTDPEFPLWAYGYKEPPTNAEDWSDRCEGTRPRDCDRPGGLPRDATGQLLSVPGSGLQFPVEIITHPYTPADWFPDDHPLMPELVAHGKEQSGFRACAICHYPNGHGLMQNGPLAGQSVQYLLRQLEDFANDRRLTADLNKANGFEMAAMARNMTAEEKQAAAEYYASIPFQKWVHVIESDTVPVFTATRNGLFLEAEGDATEPLGMRVIEMPEDTYQSNMLRNPRSGMKAFVPVGSIARGKVIATTGGERSIACVTCHGQDLRGTVIAPPIAGRQPSYLARQLYDIKVGTRAGSNVALMIASARQLTEEDMINIVAYVSSLDP